MDRCLLSELNPAGLQPIFGHSFFWGALSRKRRGTHARVELCSSGSGVRGAAGRRRRCHCAMGRGANWRAVGAFRDGDRAGRRGPDADVIDARRVDAQFVAADRGAAAAGEGTGRADVRRRRLAGAIGRGDCRGRGRGTVVSRRAAAAGGALVGACRRRGAGERCLWAAARGELGVLCRGHADRRLSRVARGGVSGFNGADSRACGL